MADKGNGISGTALTAAALGSILLWSSVKGKKWSNTIRELIAGNQPTDVQDYPIDTTVADNSNTSATGNTGVTGPASGGKAVCASVYGGPNDHTSSTGYHGDNLNGTMAFAELRLGTALGNLPYRQKIRISYKGRSVVAIKLDVGAGGAGCGGHSRDIDLWWETANALGFSGGLDVVTYELI